MSIMNKARSRYYTFKAIGCQGSKRYEKALEYCMKADALTPNDPIVATFFYSAYSSLSQWEKAREIALIQVEKDPSSGIWNQYIVETSAKLNIPVSEYISYLEAFVYEHENQQKKAPPFWLNIIFLIVDIICWPLLFFRSNKSVFISKRIKKSWVRSDAREDAWYDWAVKTLEIFKP